MGEVGEVGRGQMMKGPVNLGKEFGFYFTCKWKS